MTDSFYMSLALSLAKRRKGYTAPNPTVGCVIVKDGEIVGLGYHERAGLPHAEAIALSQAGKRAEGSTVYVTLEPCSHYGRTPPCVDALINAKVKRVVIATEDKNPVVSGNGIRKLKEAGIEVKVGVCKKEAEELNEDFFTFITENRPYITLKFAQTIDGKLATVTGDSKWITSLKSRRYAHRLRQIADAVLVGVNTVLKDDPLLTVRHFPSEKQPIRVIIDPELETPEDAKVINDRSSKTLIFYSRRDAIKEEILKSKGAELIFIEEINLNTILEELKRRNIMHVLVEGGAYTITQFLKNNLWDRIVVFQAPKILGEGISLGDLGIESIKDSLKLKLRREFKLGEERVFEFIKEKKEEGLKW